MGSNRIATEQQQTIQQTKDGRKEGRKDDAENAEDNVDDSNDTQGIIGRPLPSTTAQQ